MTRSEIKVTESESCKNSPFQRLSAPPKD